MANRIVAPAELAKLAKDCREAVGKTRAEVARDLGVSQPTLFFAEEEPERGLHKLRKLIIERYSKYEVTGPFYVVRKKR